MKVLVLCLLLVAAAAAKPFLRNSIFDDSKGNHPSDNTATELSNQQELQPAPHDIASQPPATSDNKTSKPDPKFPDPPRFDPPSKNGDQPPDFEYGSGATLQPLAHDKSLETGQHQPGYDSSNSAAQPQQVFYAPYSGSQAQPGFDASFAGGQTQPGFDASLAGGQIQGFDASFAGGQSQQGFDASLAVGQPQGVDATFAGGQPQGFYALFAGGQPQGVDASFAGGQPHGFDASFAFGHPEQGFEASFTGSQPQPGFDPSFFDVQPEQGSIPPYTSGLTSGVHQQKPTIHALTSGVDQASVAGLRASGIHETYNLGAGSPFMGSLSIELDDDDDDSFEHDDDDAYYFILPFSGSRPTKYTSLDLSQVNFDGDRARSSGHRDYLRVADSDGSGEDLYRLVGVAPSAAVQGGSAVTYSANIAADIPIYTELDDDNDDLFYYIRRGMFKPTAYSAKGVGAGAGSRPFTVRAEGTLAGDNFALLLDD